jgi:hypothetical protein
MIEKYCGSTSCVFNTKSSKEHTHECEDGMCEDCTATITNMETLMSSPPDDSMCEECGVTIIKMVSMSYVLTPFYSCKDVEKNKK